jgi:serine/threonine-protein kinase
MSEAPVPRTPGKSGADADEDTTVPRPAPPADEDTTVPRPAPPARPSGRAFPLEGWDRYEILSFIGEGGMGKVYRARDPRLCRDVALKLVRAESAEEVGRFLREARAQARAAHPNICKVFEVGEAPGHAFIAMQLIEGRSLKDMRPELTREQAVKLIQTVSEAIHPAHRLGLVHRDIKPSNVMIEQAEDGALHPYVMDFGIARDAAAGQTQTWGVEGTPLYMAPEQAKGKVAALDRRSDVYSLGATLYELLCGRPPFVGDSNIEVLFAALNDDAEPARKHDPSIPIDLETIVMKCLSKEPQGRYDSARALAEDLQRYLDGEPIRGRRATWAYRARMKARKHKALVALASAALVAVLSLGGVAARARWLAAEQARLSQQLGQDVEAMGQFLRFAYAMPLHDATRERGVILARMRDIEARMGRMGSAGEGPGHHALGRGYLALHRAPEALAHLQAAWSSGYRTPEVEYALGLVLGEMYKAEIEDARRIPDERARAARLKEAEERYLAPALDHVRQSRAQSAQVESPLYVEGLIALYGRRYGEALEKARRAFEASPWLYEARVLEGDIARAEGNEKRQQGAHDEAFRAWDRAAEAYRAAEQMARSDASIYQAEAQLWRDRIEAEVTLGRSPKASFERAAAVCDDAIAADPESAEAFATKSKVHFWWGYYQSETGEDPRAELRIALEAAAQAEKRNPLDAGTLDAVGNTHLTLAIYEPRQGLDPRPSFDRAQESFRKAIALDARFTWPWNDLGVSYKERADYESKHGLDPRPSLAEAVKACREAMALDPAYAYAPSNACYALVARGGYEVTIGVDPRGSLDEALSYCDKAVQIGLGVTPTENLVAVAHVTRGKFELESGRDPRPELEKAGAVLAKLIAESRADIDTYAALATAQRVRAAYLLEQQGDPAEALAAGEDATRKMLEIGPNEPGAHPLRGELATLAGRFAAQRRQDPAAHFREAEAALSRALALGVKTADTYAALAELYLRWAEHDAGAGGAVTAKGLAAAKEALAIHPGMAAALAAQGLLRLQSARAAKIEEERRAAAAEAARSLEEAVRRNALLRPKLGAPMEDAAHMAETSGARLAGAP